MSAIDRLLGLVEDSSIKSPCRVVSLASITLNGLQTIDAVALAQDDRVLVNGQTDATQNGIYAADTGDWQRTPDCNGTRDLVKGTIVIVTSGTAYANTSWELTTVDPVVGEALSWTRNALSSQVSNFPGVISILDYGGDPTGVADLSLSIQAAHDAMPSSGGTIYIPAGDLWSVRSAVILTKPTVLMGAGEWLTILNVGAAFALTSGKLFTSRGRVNFESFKILGIPSGGTPDPTLLNYTAIYNDTGSGVQSWRNVIVWGCGTGFDWSVAHVGSFVNLSCYYFTVDGYHFGGLANQFSAEQRIFQGVINNPNITGITNNTTVAPSRVIFMADTSLVTVGDGFATQNVPAGTKVFSKTATSVTLDADTTGNVPTSRYVRFGAFLQGNCIHVENNSFDLNFTDMLIAGGECLIRFEGEPNIGAGLYRADSAFFNNMNATASTYFGVYITGGTVIHFNDTHIGDVPFGNTVHVSSSTNVAADVTDIHFNGTMVGGAGAVGAYFDYASNIFFTDARVVGNSQLGSALYNSVYCSPHCKGIFDFTGGHAGNMVVDNSVGPVAYGVYLDTGSFAGAGDTVNVDAKLSGVTGPFLDGSVPVYPLKTVNFFGGGGRPAFRVGKSGTQVIAPAAGDVKVIWGSEQYDYASYFSSDAFRPPAGVYHVQVSVSFGTAQTFTMSIYKNGSAQSTTVVDLNTTGFIADDVVSDGNDVFEVYVNIAAGGTIAAGQDVTYFSGA